MIKRKISFDMLVTLLKQNHAVVLYGKDNEPSVELTLEEGDHPEDQYEAGDRIADLWDEL